MGFGLMPLPGGKKERVQSSEFGGGSMGNSKWKPPKLGGWERGAPKIRTYVKRVGRVSDVQGVPPIRI